MLRRHLGAKPTVTIRLGAIVGAAHGSGAFLNHHLSAIALDGLTGDIFGIF